MFSAAILALAVGLTLGLLGGGGSILTVPVLVYLLDVPVKEAIATSLVVVGVTAGVAALRHARAGRVCWKSGLLFSSAGIVGAFLGGYAADWFSSTTLLVLFALMMGAAGVAMLVSRPTPAVDRDAPGQPGWVVFIEGLVVGAVTGLVGAGGGFLVVPALVLLGGLSMKEAIGTSLLVIALKSAGGFVGHATHVEIDWALAGGFTLAAVLGAEAGARLGEHLSGLALRRGFAVFVLVMAAAVLQQELDAPEALEASAMAEEVAR